LPGCGDTAEIPRLIKINQYGSGIAYKIRFGSADGQLPRKCRAGRYAIPDQQGRKQRETHTNAMRGGTGPVGELAFVNGVVTNNGCGNSHYDHCRRQKRQVPGHFRHHEHHSQWRMGDSTEHADHAYNDERRRIGRHTG